VSKTLREATELSELCLKLKEKYESKLRMHSDLEAIIGKLDLKENSMMF
jgi:hypothetical protein